MCNQRQAAEAATSRPTLWWIMLVGPTHKQKRPPEGGPLSRQVLNCD
jgi:hypothetical protein